ncbi:MAG: sirohydrochlorin nickelochelatase [Candidatus Methanomethylicia archaeon]|jgi:sirohydrochlorin cobaltochelatase|nr:sirohydrochlorin nickelochelatase [Candidatus Methanomethylicia archaeon]MCQ5373797.1 sirohydrochlorin nickelochelatase [Candidatus Methanomethylicia archaeon]NHV60238.1 sirohydrochlorin nickelochelatase [Candidatus Verstraetearchaeota archaeon]
MNQQKIGVILVGHGSREPYNKEAIRHFAERLKGEYEFVDYAFMEFSKPSIHDALEVAAKSGVDILVVQPVFLTRGVHTDSDIPDLLGIPRGSKSCKIKISGKEILIKYGEPLGKDDRILEIIKTRIRESLV